MLSRQYLYLMGLMMDVKVIPTAISIFLAHG